MRSRRLRLLRGQTVSAQRHENTPPPRIANLLLRLMEKTGATVASAALFHFVRLLVCLLSLSHSCSLMMKKKKKKQNLTGRRPKPAHLRGKGSGRGLRGLLGVGGGSRRLLRDWLLCTCLSTLLFRSSKVVMITGGEATRPHL